MTRQSLRVSADNAPDNPPSKRRKLSHHNSSHHRQPSIIQSPASPRLQSKASKSKSKFTSKPKQKSASRRTRTLKSRPPRQSRPITQYTHRQLETSQTNQHRPKSFPRSFSSIKKTSSATASTSGTATPTATAAAEQCTSTKLSTTKSLLDQIWARNKNQHRSQPWWKSLGMLRKAISHLVAMDGAEHSLKLLHGSTAAAIDAKQVRHRFEQETQIRREREVWFGWMREILVPRAYVGFTALVADTQFAALGLVLVGILADVMGVVGAPTPMDDWKEQHSSGIRGAPTINAPGVIQPLSKILTARSLRVTGSQSGEVVERMYDSDDLGEVVERTNLNGNSTELSGSQSRSTSTSRNAAATTTTAAAPGLDDSMATVDNAGNGVGPSVPVSDLKRHRTNTQEAAAANSRDELSVIPSEPAPPSTRHRLLSMEAESDRAQKQKPDTTTIKGRSRTDERTLPQELQASESKPKSSRNNGSKIKYLANHKAKVEGKGTTTTNANTMTATNTTTTTTAAAGATTAKIKKMTASTPTIATKKQEKENKEKDKKEKKKKKNAIDDMFSGFI